MFRSRCPSWGQPATTSGMIEHNGQVLLMQFCRCALVFPVIIKFITKNQSTGWSSKRTIMIKVVSSISCGWPAGHVHFPHTSTSRLLVPEISPFRNHATSGAENTRRDIIECTSLSIQIKQFWVILLWSEIILFLSKLKSLIRSCMLLVQNIVPGVSEASKSWQVRRVKISYLNEVGSAVTMDESAPGSHHSHFMHVTLTILQVSNGLTFGQRLQSYGSVNRNQVHFCRGKAIEW